MDRRAIPVLDQMKIILFGKNGQVGWELQRSLSILGEVIAIDRTQIGGDLSKPFACYDLIKSEFPNVVVNAAAYTAVDHAERETALCWRVNAEAVGEIASACAEVGALFVHYSTDYVFDGSGSLPWNEEDPTGPLNVYGRTKLGGETKICQSGCRFIIFRTSWVYGLHGNNFAKTILMHAQVSETLRVISDQFGVPTGADMIADVTAYAIKCCQADYTISGIFNLAPNGVTTWLDYAKFCIENALKNGLTLRSRPSNIIPISANEYNSAASRPLNSRLNINKIQKVFGLRLPDWDIGLQRYLRYLIIKDIQNEQS